jgi:peptidoglycan/LPS O-acetylase OafA/YrhL
LLLKLKSTRLQQLHNSRNSSLETLRLIAMAIIIFHHFVVHGIFPAVNIQQHHTFGVLISLLVGWDGYLGNSLFILMTGYFSVREYTDTILPCARTFFTTLPQLFDHPSGSICHPAQ